MLPHFLRKKEKMKLVIAIVVVMALVPGLAIASSWTADSVALSGTVGSGSNASYLVVDFGSASYAFKYLWSPEQHLTGLDLLHAATSAGLTVTSHSAAYGEMIDSMSYGGNTGTASTASDWWNYPWWNYWTGSNGGPIASASVGCSSSPLANGSVDAWVFTTDWAQTPAGVVPEPSSLLALASLVGCAVSAGLIRRRRS